MWTLCQAVRRVWALLHSGLTPAQIALGFCLGLVAGLVPWGRNTVVWLLAAWVLDVSVGAALLGLALGRLLAWPLLPASVAVGRALLDAEALEPLWRGLAYAPGLVWLELWRYAVLGGYALALALSVPAFFGVKALVQGYRARVGPRLQPRSRAARVALRLLLGGAPAAPAHPRARARARWRGVRVPALVALLIAALLGAGVVARVAPPLVRGALARGASWVVGGEVRVEGVEASALTGRLRVGTLEVQNPNKPEEDVLRVRSVALDLGVLPLLMSRRLVFNEIAVGEVELHVKRQRDGSLNLDDPIEADPDWRSYFEWLRANAEKIDWLELWRRYGERYGRWAWARLKRALLERLAPGAAPPSSPEGAEPLKALKPLEPPWPVIALERLRVERLQLKLTDEFAVTQAEELPPLTTVDVELEDVAWPSGLNDEPAKLRLRAENIDLKAYRALYARTLPVRVERGRASVAIELNVLNGQGVRLQGRAQLVIVGLRLGLPDAGVPPSLFGLGPEASRRVVEGINAYAQRCPIAIEFAIGGTTRQPELGWDEAFLKVAKRGLLMLGTLPFAPVLNQIEAKLRASEAQEQGGLQGALEGWLKGQLGLLGADAVGADECALERER